MNLKSKYFDSIRISSESSREVEAQRGCDWPECSEGGSYPAPDADGSKDRRFFCLDHIRTYNQSFNFFEGMSEEDIQAYQRSAHTGHRPTWTMGANRASPSEATDWQWQDPLDLMPKMAARQKAGNAPRKASTGQTRALGALGLDATATADEVKTRYKQRIKQYHPDANGGDRKYEQQMNAVLQAFNYLKASGFC